MIAVGFVGLLVLAIVVVALWITFTRLLYVSTPNEVLIFSGTQRTVGDRTVGYRFVRGGRSVRRPFIEHVDRMDLNMITVVVSVEHAFTKGGVPLTIQGVANVKLPGEEPRLMNAVERFLGRGRDDIHHIVKETLEGNLRGVLASLTPEEINEDKTRFAHMLLEEAEHDMARMGLVLDTLKIQNVTDEVSYLSSIGRIRTASLNQIQAIAEIEARADAAVQQAANWAASQVAKVQADLEIMRQETAKRIADARSKREAVINESRSEVLAQVAEAKAEITQQKARAPQVKRRLDADVVQPAIAAQRAAEEKARGEAARLVERGRAEAIGLKKIAEAYREGGVAARDALALQNLLPLLGQVSGAGRSLHITKVSILPADGGPGGAAARTAIGAAEQIRAATGVDVSKIAKKLGG